MRQAFSLRRSGLLRWIGAVLVVATLVMSIAGGKGSTISRLVADDWQNPDDNALFSLVDNRSLQTTILLPMDWNQPGAVD